MSNSGSCGSSDTSEELVLFYVAMVRLLIYNVMLLFLKVKINCLVNAFYRRWVPEINKKNLLAGLQILQNKLPTHPFRFFSFEILTLKIPC